MTGTILSALEILTHFFIVRLEVQRGTAYGHQGPFWDNGNDWIVMTAQLCKLTRDLKETRNCGEVSIGLWPFLFKKECIKKIIKKECID